MPPRRATTRAARSSTRRPRSRNSLSSSGSRTPRRVISKTPARTWAQVTRPPKRGISFLVTCWKPLESLTSEERAKWEQTQAKKLAVVPSGDSSGVGNDSMTPTQPQPQQPLPVTTATTTTIDPLSMGTAQEVSSPDYLMTSPPAKRQRVEEQGTTAVDSSGVDAVDAAAAAIEPLVPTETTANSTTTSTSGNPIPMDATTTTAAAVETTTTTALTEEDALIRLDNNPTEPAAAANPRQI